MKRKKKLSFTKKIERMIISTAVIISIIAGLFYFTGIDPVDTIYRAADLYDNFASSSGIDLLERSASAPTLNDSNAISTAGVTSEQTSILTGFEQIKPRNGELSVIILDIGQGNAVYVQTPSGYNMLIDTGEAEMWSKLNEYLVAFGVTKLDILVGTHPHSDHIGSMQNVLENYEVGIIYMPRVTHTTSVYTDLIAYMQDKGITATALKGGLNQSITLDKDVEIRVLAPLKDEYESLNNYSISFRIAYGTSSIILTGDAEQESESQMVSEFGDLLASDVLLVGHHGSNTSTSSAFLKAVSPSVGFISAGADNTYGHPTETILNRLSKQNIIVYRTDENGSLAFFAGTEGYEICFERN